MDRSHTTCQPADPSRSPPLGPNPPAAHPLRGTDDASAEIPPGTLARCSMSCGGNKEGQGIKMVKAHFAAWPQQCESGSYRAPRPCTNPDSFSASQTRTWYGDVNSDLAICPFHPLFSGHSRTSIKRHQTPRCPTSPDMFSVFLSSRLRICANQWQSVDRLLMLFEPSVAIPRFIFFPLSDPRYPRHPRSVSISASPYPLCENRH